MVVGRVPLIVPGAEANGNIIVLQTAERLKPRKWPSSWVSARAWIPRARFETNLVPMRG